ncbi:uncharacterized protein B0H18DRAFT_616960 [Fomitopsis serialis]|uniref:uncharacterized protein n=1 Tax=Fomitopsis serialis TaxID=139415 RepID=UPI0020084BB0|nr:uncharacterized protein B0H18DRAFT_616960 [Neoantrodia serialis]KAH9920080.1 hypothetical protein B0H18DRAFT_616960 [Neoantrodia serialis]
MLGRSVKRHRDALAIVAVVHQYLFLLLHLTMPAPNRGHRAQGGMTRTHSRTNSGGSSKLGLNLQLTQKDVLPPKLPDKSRKSAHFIHEPAARTGTISRTGSTTRLPSREQIAPAQLRRAPPPPLGAARTKDGKHRAGFTISSPSEGDDDEWVSSESGAATPNAGQSDSEADDTTTPVEPARPHLPPSATQVNGFHREEVVTPKAEVPPLPRADPTKTERPISPTPHDYISSQPIAQLSASQSQQLAHHDQLSHSPDSLPPPITKARSETHSPSRSTSPPPKRQSMTRPPSTHSVTSRTDGASLRPHPLIRGHSYGQGAPFAAKPAPLAPLTMVSSDAAQAQMSSASSPSSLRAGSPTSVRTASPNRSSPTSSEAHRQLRRTSTSSARSTATMPTQSASQAQLSRSNHDRQRTLSTISSSSSFAALSHLALRSTPSPPRESIRFTSHLPPVDQLQSLEAVHPLLPPPYLNSHISILTYRNPVAESYDRITRAKQAR